MVAMIVETCQTNRTAVSINQWYGLRLSILGQERSETRKSVLVLVLHAVFLQVMCCVVKHGLVALVVIMILKDIATFKVLFIVSLYRA